MRKFLLALVTSALLSQSVMAAPSTAMTPHLAPQPTTCIGARFRVDGDKWWKNIQLKLTNNCGKAVDFQNAAVTFKNRSALNTTFWGAFDTLPYPDNELKITSQKQADGKYLATFNLHFPTNSTSTTMLQAGRSITIKYGTNSETHISNSTLVYLGSPVATGSIEFTNTTVKPVNVAQNYALVHLTVSGQNIGDIQVPWSGVQTVANLAPASYAVSADNVVDINNGTYQGTATPASFQVTAGQTAKVTVAYTKVQQVGKIAIGLQALPTQLAGYTGKPTVLLTEIGSGSSTPVSIDWNTTATVSQLKNGSTYNLSTPVISYNGTNCTPAFTPASLIASDPASTSTLGYTCTQVVQVNATLNVSGAPTNLSSLLVTLTPNNNTAATSQTVTLTNGSGSNTAMLTNGVIYNVSAGAVSGYTVSFNPQPLMATANVIENITLTAQTGTPVAVNGQLAVCGTHLCNQQGNQIQLRGMSSHGLQWYGLGVCLTQASLNALATDWGASVMRISMYVQEDGYETDPVGFTNQVSQLIEEAYRRGIYAIVDWHQLTPGDPNFNLTRAKKFFTDIATIHKDKNNLLYEIANEPNGVNWSSIKSYAEALIPVIRAIDPKTVIIVGTPGWSSLGVSDGRTSQDIINQPLAFSNIMYTFHFYAASHKDEYYNELDRASDVLPIFVTEWGTQTFSGDGSNDFVMSQRYVQLMAAKKISWTNWNYSDDFRSGAVWKTGTCSAGPWTDANLKPAGVWIKARIQGIAKK